MLDRTVTFILAAGGGTHLHPLTAERAKPAVPFGGKFRIIDFALSNCLHSGLRQVLVLPQYKSHSLCKHLRDGWSIYNPSIGEYITPVPPQMRTDESWYAGTADAVYQNLYLLERSGAEHVVILSGEHIYRMDYAALVAEHVESSADVTIACHAVLRDASGRLSTVEIDDEQWVRRWYQDSELPPDGPADPTSVLAPMSVYVFRRESLVDALREDHARVESAHDFGRDVLPRLSVSHRVRAYTFGGVAGRVSADKYWREVGTVDDYYRANMDLLDPVPPLDLYQTNWPIRTAEAQSPPARTIRGQQGNEPEIINSMLCEGTIVSGGAVWHSILSRDVRVEDDAVVEASILFDGVHVGPGARLKRCIVDKSVVIPAGAEIGFDPAADTRRFTVSEGGVVVIPKGYRFDGPNNGKPLAGSDTQFAPIT